MLSSTLSDAALQLRRRLAAEMMQPQPGTHEPLIIEEKSNFPGRVRLIVIWQDWNGMPQRERSQVVAGAYEDAFGAVRASAVTVSSGFTPSEAEALGYRW